jgi:hypothetical protein
VNVKLKAWFASPRPLRSGSAEHPTPRDLVRDMVAGLVASKRWSWVTFESKLRRFVEVAHDDETLTLNVAYPFTEDYQTLFAERGIAIPAGWTVTEFKRKGCFNAGVILLQTDIDDQERVADFIVHLFPALLGEKANFALSGTYQQ